MSTIRRSQDDINQIICRIHSGIGSTECLEITLLELMNDLNVSDLGTNPFFGQFTGALADACLPIPDTFEPICSPVTCATC